MMYNGLGYVMHSPSARALRNLHRYCIILVHTVKHLNLLKCVINSTYIWIPARIIKPLTYSCMKKGFTLLLYVHACNTVHELHINFYQLAELLECAEHVKYSLRLTPTMSCISLVRMCRTLYY